MTSEAGHWHLRVERAGIHTAIPFFVGVETSCDFRIFLSTGVPRAVH